jgi:hypothetical protein
MASRYLAKPSSTLSSPASAAHSHSAHDEGPCPLQRGRFEPAAGNQDVVFTAQAEEVAIGVFYVLQASGQACPSLLARILARGPGKSLSRRALEFAAWATSDNRRSDDGLSSGAGMVAYGRTRSGGPRISRIRTDYLLLRFDILRFPHCAVVTVRCALELFKFRGRSVVLVGIPHPAPLRERRRD